MNKKMVRKMDGKRVRVRPVPVRLWPSLRGLGWLPEAIDDIWRVEVGFEPGVITLHNTRTDHFIPINYPQILGHEFDPLSHGFLRLKARIFIHNLLAWTEPILACS